MDAISSPSWDPLPYSTAPSRPLEPRFISVFLVPWIWVDHSLFNNPSNGQSWVSFFIAVTPACISRRAALSCAVLPSCSAEPCILCRAAHLCFKAVCVRSLLSQSLGFVIGGFPNRCWLETAPPRYSQNRVCALVSIVRRYVSFARDFQLPNVSVKYSGILACVAAEQAPFLQERTLYRS